MKRKYLFLLCFLFSCEAWSADGLGRLFLTPEQRTQLDAIRARRDPRLPVVGETEPATATAPAAPAAPPGPDTVTYNGMVRRSDGKSTVWINGKAVDERNRVRGPHEVNVVGLHADGAVSVAVPQASRAASLRVGQILSVNSGKIEESYVHREVLSPNKEHSLPVPATTPPSATSRVQMNESLSASSEPVFARPARITHEKSSMRSNSSSRSTSMERGEKK